MFSFYDYLITFPKNKTILSKWRICGLLKNSVDCTYVIMNISKQKMGAWGIYISLNVRNWIIGKRKQACQQSTNTRLKLPLKYIITRERRKMLGNSKFKIFYKQTNDIILLPNIHLYILYKIIFIQRLGDSVIHKNSTVMIKLTLLRYKMRLQCR